MNQVCRALRDQWALLAPWDPPVPLDRKDLPDPKDQRVNAVNKVVMAQREFVEKVGTRVLPDVLAPAVHEDHQAHPELRAHEGPMVLMEWLVHLALLVPQVSLERSASPVPAASLVMLDHLDHEALMGPPDHLESLESLANLEHPVFRDRLDVMATKDRRANPVFVVQQVPPDPKVHAVSLVQPVLQEKPVQKVP